MARVEADLLRHFRKKLDKQVDAYCDACYETGRHRIEVTKNFITLDCFMCNQHREYQRMPDTSSSNLDAEESPSEEEVWSPFPNKSS